MDLKYFGQVLNVMTSIHICRAELALMTKEESDCVIEHLITIHSSLINICRIVIRAKERANMFPHEVNNIKQALNDSGAGDVVSWL